MQWLNTRQRYGAVAQLFHWLITALIVVQLVLGVYGAFLPLSIDKLIVLARHKSIGITILALVIVRLCWRLYNPPPPLPQHMPRSQRVLAHASHAILYMCLIALPITGWLFSSADAIAVSWFNLVALPDIVAPNPALAHVLRVVHQVLAITFVCVVCGHIGAALWHHFVQRDGVLMRMWPGFLKQR